MRKLSAAYVLLCGLLAFPAAQADLFSNAAPPLPAAEDAAATLVVFNSNDPESKPLAEFYASKRHIPKDRVLGLPCPASEEISREEYDRLLVEPLRRAFTANFWWKLRSSEGPSPVETNKIHFMALMRGIPLKIAGTEHYRGDDPSGASQLGARNEAAVDSELATLGLFSRQISGALHNPYYRSFLRIGEARRPELMLVCRLDGPSDAVVRRMISDSLAAEEEGLAGLAYIDARGLQGGNYQEGDDWLKAAAGQLRRQGFPVVLDDRPELFPQGYPMTHPAIYYGWYSNDAAGVFVEPGVHFVRGAVAVHIHSFSAATLRDPHRCWAAPLLVAGAAATLGNVYEPYLSLTPHLDLFHDRLRAGFTFAEASYASVLTLSWMNTFIGDPLYRPFKGAEFGDEAPHRGEWAVYRAAARTWYSKDRASGEAALQAAGRKLRSGVIFEGLGLLEASVTDWTAALAAYRQARTFYSTQEDILRTALHEVEALRAVKRFPEAAALVRQMAAAYPRAPATAVLRESNPPAAPAPPSPTAK